MDVFGCVYDEVGPGGSNGILLIEIDGSEGNGIVVVVC